MEPPKATRGRKKTTAPAPASTTPATTDAAVETNAVATGRRRRAAPRGNKRDRAACSLDSAVQLCTEDGSCAVTTADAATAKTADVATPKTAEQVAQEAALLAWADSSDAQIATTAEAAAEFAADAEAQVKPRRPRVKRTVKHDNDFQRHVLAHMGIRPSSVPNIGMGAFWDGTEPLPARRRIGVYAGRILKRQPHDCTYLFEISTNKRPKYVCARNTRYSNWTRYINDPRPARAANVYFTADGRVTTLRQIQPGEELFIDYGEWYFHTDKFVVGADGVVTPAATDSDTGVDTDAGADVDVDVDVDVDAATGTSPSEADATGDASSRELGIRVVVDDDDSLDAADAADVATVADGAVDAAADTGAGA